MKKCSQKFAQNSGSVIYNWNNSFSGSLYLLTAGKAAETASLDKAGIITPFGGVAFIAGWLFLFLAAMKKTEKIIMAIQVLFQCHCY